MTLRKFFFPLITCLVLAVMMFGLLRSATNAWAQTDDIIWTVPINLSQTEATSTDPYLISDPAGIVHLVWAEKVGLGPGNAADTVMYTNWDGNSWSQPTDIFFASEAEGNPLLTYPKGIMDGEGNLHLYWLQEPNPPNYAVYYSSAPSLTAGNPTTWKQPRVLAADLTGTHESIDMAIRLPKELHLVFARVPISDNPKELRAVSYMVSHDGGATWSQPVDIFKIPDPDRGASATRIVLENPDRIYVTWTEWDSTGNGQVVRFIRSLDNGRTWDQPVVLAKRVGLEYERDWNNFALIGEKQLVTIWEGGFRAYRHVMYSSDGGETWTDPVDVFPYLIGDNGPVDFFNDSTGRLHVFVANRIREGNIDRAERSGLWHSVLEEGRRWRDPVLSGGDNPMTNPKTTVVNGNRVVAVWYAPNVYEIVAMTGVIQGAPFAPSITWPTPTPPLIPEQTSTSTPVLPTSVPTQTAAPIAKNNDSDQQPSMPGINIFIGVFPALLIVIGFMIWLRLRPGVSS